MSFYRSFLEDLRDLALSHNIGLLDSLEVLSGKVLCFSSAFFCRCFLQMPVLDPFNRSVSAGIRSELEKIRENFQAFNIHLMVVFDGVRITKSEEVGDATGKLWKQIVSNKGVTSPASALLRYFLEDSVFFQLLTEIGIDALYAPFHSYHQIRWLMQNNFADGVAADLDFFALSTSGFANLQIITGFDFKLKRFTFIDSKRFATLFDAKPPESLPDLFSYAGFLTAEQPFASSKEVFDAFRKGHKPESLKNFDSIRRRIDAIPVLTCKGELEVHPVAKTASEIQEVLGFRLPAEAFVLQALGLISPELMNLLAKGTMETKDPAGDSIELRRLYRDSFFNIYQGILALLLNPLPKSLERTFEFEIYAKHQRKKFKVDEIVLKGPFISEEQISLNSTEKLNFKTALVILGSTLKESKGGRPRLESADAFLLGGTSSSDDISLSSPKTVRELTLEKLTERELHLHLLLCFLDFFNYWKRASQSFNFLGLQLRRAEGEFDEEVMILLEIMKTDASQIFGRSFLCSETHIPDEDSDFVAMIQTTKFLKTEDKSLSEDKKPWITCVSRVFGLIPSSKPYGFLKNYYEFDSSQYLSVLQATCRLLQQAYDAHIFSIFFNILPSNKSVLRAFCEIKKKHSPFNKHFNNHLGMAVRLLAQGKLKITEPEDRTVFQKDFARGLRLWENLKQVICYENQGRVGNELMKNLFCEANQFLQKIIADNPDLLRS